jgi:hypothetical protein
MAILRLPRISRRNQASGDQLFQLTLRSPTATLVYRTGWRSLPKVAPTLQRRDASANPSDYSVDSIFC